LFENINLLFPVEEKMSKRPLNNLFQFIRMQNSFELHEQIALVLAWIIHMFSNPVYFALMVLLRPDIYFSNLKMRKP